jgi:hypothetical protein
MTASTKPNEGSPAPGDVPAERPPSLEHLEALVGQWELEATFDAGYFGPDSTAVTASGGRTVFEWLAGRYFLIQRFTSENPAAPDGLAVIGASTGADAFTQHYYDSRGVARVYEMTLRGSAWTIWREAPGFWQRYTGLISADGSTITGAWENSPDGRDWKHDFALTYTRAGAPRRPLLGAPARSP